MPEYEITTKQTTVKTHKLGVELPVDMGASTVKLTDRMVRAAIENKTLLNQVDADQGTEQLDRVTRRDGLNEVQIWPRPRKQPKVETPVPKIPLDADDLD